MKYTYTLAVLLLWMPFMALCQEYGQISTGVNYANQSYYQFASESETLVPNESWDLMFSAFGVQDAGIHINESTTSSFTNPLPELELYLATTQDFSETIDPQTLETRIYND